MRPRFSGGWFAPRAPHLSPHAGAENRGLLSELDAIAFQPDDEYPQHALALIRLREVFERVLVPWSYIEERDAVGLCGVNCHVATLLERDPDADCIVFSMGHGGRLRERELNGNGFIPQFFQGRSSAGADRYPGDRAFAAPRPLLTVQIHRLNLTQADQTWANVPALAVRLPLVRGVLVHIE